MKTKIIIIAIVILAIGLLMWGKTWPSRREESSAHTTGSTPVNVAEQTPAYDFGSVSMARGNVEHDFVITNTADADLTITKAETSCMCTNAVLILPNGEELGPFGMSGHGFTPSINVVVRPGETLTVRAVFDPTAHGPAGIGKIERVVALATTKGPVVMQFSAQVTP